MASRYEQERLPRVRTVYQKGKSAASADDKEEYLYKPTFKPLWRKQASCLGPSNSKACFLTNCLPANVAHQNLSDFLAPQIQAHSSAMSSWCHRCALLRSVTMHAFVQAQVSFGRHICPRIAHLFLVKPLPAPPGTPSQPPSKPTSHANGAAMKPVLHGQGQCKVAYIADSSIACDCHHFLS